MDKLLPVRLYDFDYEVQNARCIKRSARNKAQKSATQHQLNNYSNAGLQKIPGQVIK